MVANEKWFGASGDFYPETINQSVRFNGSSSQLNITPSSTGNRKTFTTSLWVKRSKISSSMEFHTGGSNSYNTQSTQFGINSSDQLQFYDVLAGITNYAYVRSDNLLRDTSNWYHIVLAVDTTQSTASDRVKLYLNGSEVSYVSSPTYPSQNHQTVRNNSGTLTRIGRFPNVAVNFFSGYIAEFNHIDGTALTPSSFGELKNSVWTPKSLSSLTYGTNGFRLTFADSSNLGDDTSGNGNDFTSSGLSASGPVTDSPTNNFSTLNSIGNDTEVTFSEGNLKVSVPQNINATPRCEGTFAVSRSKWYWEVNIISIDSGSSTPMVGIKDLTISGHESQIFSGASVYGYYANSGNKYNSGNLGSYGATYTAGDIIGVALDLDAGTLTFYKNGSSQGTAFSSLSGEYTIHFGTGYYAYTAVVNFGQDGTFAGNETAQGNTDANGVGDFYYSPPSGHLALCSSNLPDTTISPSKSTQADDHFNTVLYTGNGTTDRAIDVGFATDWFWVKQRSGTNVHQLTDSSRGALKGLNSDQTSAENTFDSVRSFTSTGVTVGTSATTNSNGGTYVAWNWKAGGTEPTKIYKVKVVADSTDYGHGTGSNKYQFFKSDGTTGFGTNGVDLDLQEGGTYVFDYSDSSAQSHPLRFSLTNDGTHSSGTSAGSEYTTGVVKDDSAYKITITVASGVATLYYYCANHSGMGGQVNTNTTHGSTNFDGSILSVVQTNETAKFSILTYTGTGSASTIGHGLGIAPNMVITKVRSTANNWAVYHVGINDNTKAVLLDTTGAATAYGGSTSLWNNTAPTSTVFSVGTNSSTGGSANFVAYVFAEVEGYSKFGTYTGNGSTDGTFVYTGFRPSWIMLKKTSSTGQWLMFDNKRNGFNPDNRELASDTSASEQDYDRLDFVSNGFKQRTNFSHNNASGSTYIYMAFADQPFKFSNAR